jgi:hypothetical protein
MDDPAGERGSEGPPERATGTSRREAIGRIGALDRLQRRSAADLAYLEAQAERVDVSPAVTLLDKYWR